ncbi:MAG: radical protein [Deltaproteobacteria bacterium]|nr:radical protein [Deltaproteobacteria bacterium]
METFNTPAKNSRPILINPPVAKPCEAPAGISRLAGALQSSGHACTVVDMNIEGILWLLRHAKPGDDTWTSRAGRNIDRNLDALRDKKTYLNFDRYKRCVNDINRILHKASSGDTRISLSDYEDRRLSPLRSCDLREAADHPKDNPFYAYFSARIREILADHDPPFIGFSLTYLSQALTTFAAIGFVRAEFPSLKIILGGALVTSWMSNSPVKINFNGLIDHIVSGPGEAYLAGLVGSQPQDTISSLYAYDVFPSGDYLTPGTIMPYSTSTGCYYGKCTFCPETAEGNGYRQLNPQRAAKAIGRLACETRPSLIHIVDNAISPAVLKALVKEPPGRPWYGFVRITRELTDPDFCMQLKDSGCVLLKIGVESGDQDVLDAMRKGIDIGDVSQGLRALSEAGIGTYVYLLFGTPWENELSARRTLDFIVEHNSYINYLNLAIFNLPHYSPDAKGLEQKAFYGGDLSFYTDFVHPMGWERKKVRHFLDRVFTRHPAVRRIVKRQPPCFTSNHAAFFMDTFC